MHLEAPRQHHRLLRLPDGEEGELVAEDGKGGGGASLEGGDELPLGGGKAAPADVVVVRQT